MSRQKFSVIYQRCFFPLAGRCCYDILSLTTAFWWYHSCCTSSV